MSLTADEKKTWVDALRSGSQGCEANYPATQAEGQCGYTASVEYKQTKGTLHNLDDGGFCCLGLGALVLGVASKEHMGVKPKHFYDNGEPKQQGPQDVYAYWREKLGIEVVLHLTKMNDRGDTFAEIADFIEEKL